MSWRVVILEDDIDLHARIRELLAHLDVRLEFHTTPAAALAAVTHERPDLIISDVNMNPQDPFDTGGLRHFVGPWREQDERTPLILMSSDPTYAKAAHRMGVPFVCKLMLDSVLADEVLLQL